jgi:hypothetical protein
MVPSFRTIISAALTENTEIAKKITKKSSVCFIPHLLLLNIPPGAGFFKGYGGFP